jgi:L-ascorbate metabolism protein UlaG (beta-lactamase superfamily)
MKIKQVRNATLIIEYIGKKFLVDPLLAEKGAYPGFEGTANSHLRNPLVDLTIPMDEILDVDAVIVTHLHPDHWDEAAKALVPKDMLIFAQNADDAAAVQAAGFGNTRVLTENTEFDGISLIKTPGQHGTDQAYAVIGQILGNVCGVVFRHPDEKTLYLAGDTIWNGYVEENLRTHKPDVIVVNCGDALVPGLGSIIMGKEDVYRVYQATPGATILASHMESVNHRMLSRQELREFIAEKAMTQRVLVLEDGESVDF